MYSFLGLELQNMFWSGNTLLLVWDKLRHCYFFCTNAAHITILLIKFLTYWKYAYFSDCFLLSCFYNNTGLHYRSNMNWLKEISLHDPILFVNSFCFFCLLFQWVGTRRKPQPQNDSYNTFLRLKKLSLWCWPFVWIITGLWLFSL